MGILYLTEPGMIARKDSGCVQIIKDRVELFRKPLGQVQALVVFPGVQISSGLIHYCLNANLTITYISGSGYCLGDSATPHLNIMRQMQQVSRAAGCRILPYAGEKTD
jgi:CRISPR/Cas system-associated endonuclease Cas1